MNILLSDANTPSFALNYPSFRVCSKTNGIALPARTHSPQLQGVETKKETEKERNLVERIHYSHRLVAFSNTRLVTFHFTAFQAFSPPPCLAHPSFYSINLYWKDEKPRPGVQASVVSRSSARQK